MMFTEPSPRALFGGPVYGDQAVRYVFVDEAGTSAREPVSVVVGIIAHADAHVMAADAAVAEIMEAVPERLRASLVPHATSIFSDERLREGWSQTDRLKLLSKMMALPRRLGLAVALGTQWRGTAPYSEDNLRPEQRDHIYAFMKCVAVADRGIRDHAGAREVGTIVAENVSEVQHALAALPGALRDRPVFFAPEDLENTPADLEAGYTRQSGDFRVTRIRRGVHFVKKTDEPLVQVADACAFGFRRFFSGESFGPEFVTSILGSPDVLRNFASPGGAEVYWPRDQVDPSAWTQGPV